MLTRLVAAQESPETARALSAQVVAAIAEGLAELASRQGLDLRRVTSLAVVGNTPMLALMAGKNPPPVAAATLGDPVACRPATSAPWVETWGTHPRAAVRLIQPLAGFVGSDLLAGLVATRLLAGPAPGVHRLRHQLRDRPVGRPQPLDHLSRGGPAFELGACKVACSPNPERSIGPNGEPAAHCTTRCSGGRSPGFCGSGLVDLITRLVETGQLSRTGRFAAGAAATGGAPLEIAPGFGSLVLSMADVDALQRAKAAIGAGLRVLGRHSGITLASLARVCVAGELARSWTWPAPRPSVPFPGAGGSSGTQRRCRPAGLWGSDFSTAAEHHLAQLRRTAKLISLAHAEDFEESFLANLYLEPLKED